jgi:protein-S-isoprenylcysteine O-methyltransferase Ste14
MAMVYAGIALLTDTVWAFVTLVPVLILVDRAVIKREERYLERKFGGDYLRYRARARRWL